MAYSGLMLIITLALLVLELVALIDAAIRPAAAYVAAGKQTKQFWLVLLGVSTAVSVLVGIPGYFALGLVGVVAGSVYLVDVRPAVRSYRGGRGGNDRHMGPYGPW